MKMKYQKYIFIKHNMWVMDDCLVKIAPVTSNYFE